MIQSVIKTFISYLIEQKKVKYIILLGVFLFALLALFKVPRYAYPQIDFRELRISIVAPGSSIDDVELDLVMPIEKQLALIEGIDDYISSTQDSLSTVHVWVSEGYDFEQVVTDIRDAVARIPDLPSGLLSRISIKKISSFDQSVLSLGVISRRENMARARIHALELKKRMQAVRGVAYVDARSIPDKEINVLLSKDKLLKNNISPVEVNRALQAQLEYYSISLTRGLSNVGNLRTHKQALSEDYVEDIIVRKNSAGDNVQNITIKQLASVEEGLTSTFYERHHYDGKPGFGLDVINHRSSDVITVVDAILEVITAYQSEVGDDDLEVITLFDGSHTTRERLTTVYENIGLGLILILLTLVFFLSRMAAFWATVGIVTTIAITFIAMDLFGISFNSISLCAMIISLGMIVDAAIVVSENIYTFRERGYAAKQASLHGMSGILKPLMIMQLTTVASFGTIFLVSGSIGLMASDIPTVVIIMLVVSLFEALIFLPAHLGSIRYTQKGPRLRNNSQQVHNDLAQALKDEKDEAAHARTQFRQLDLVGKIVFFGRIRVVGFLRTLYTTFLHAMFRHMPLAFCLIILVFALSIFTVLRTSDFEMYPVAQANAMELSGQVPTGKNFADVVATVTALEEIIQELPDGLILSTHSVMGRDFYNHFEIFIEFVNFGKRDWTAVDIRDFIFAAIDARQIEIVGLAHYIDAKGPRIGAPIEISVIGENDELRVAYVATIEQDLKAMGFLEVRNDLAPRRMDRKVQPVADLHLLGVTPDVILSTLKTTFEGQIVFSFQGFDGRTKVRVQVDGAQADATTDRSFENIFVPSDRGGYLLLKDLLTEVAIPGRTSIHHRRGIRQNTIYAAFDNALVSPSQVYTSLTNKYNEDFLDEAANGITSRTTNATTKNAAKQSATIALKIGGEIIQTQETLANIIFSLVVAIVLIYLFLVLQFNNLSQPLIAVSAIPIAILGTLIMFYLHGIKFSAFAMLGMLGSGGVVVNVSLVMVEFMNRMVRDYEKQWEHSEQYPKIKEFKQAIYHAIIIGARGRFRPIFITTLTTLMGIISTVYGFINPADSFILPMTLAMFWGIATGSIGSLVVIPFFYAVEKNFHYWLRRKSLFTQLTQVTHEK